MQTCAHSNGVADKLDSVHLCCFIVVCNINRDRKRLKIRHCYCKNESFSDSRVKKTSFQGSTDVNVNFDQNSSIWPKISFTDYIQTENDEQRILGEDINLH